MGREGEGVRRGLPQGVLGTSHSMCHIQDSGSGCCLEILLLCFDLPQVGSEIYSSGGGKNY